MLIALLRVDLYCSELSTNGVFRDTLMLGAKKLNFIPVNEKAKLLGSRSVVS